jgi:hypothetical protein
VLEELGESAPALSSSSSSLSESMAGGIRGRSTRSCRSCGLGPPDGGGLKPVACVRGRVMRGSRPTLYITSRHITSHHITAQLATRVTSCPGFCCQAALSWQLWYQRVREYTNHITSKASTIAATHDPLFAVQRGSKKSDKTTRGGRIRLIQLSPTSGVDSLHIISSEGQAEALTAIALTELHDTSDLKTPGTRKRIETTPDHYISLRSLKEFRHARLPFADFAASAPLCFSSSASLRTCCA